MKNHSALLLFTLFLLISSCSKKKDNEPKYDLANVAVKSVTHSNKGTTDTYTYTSEGNIQQIQNTDGSKITYEYNGASITETFYDAGGSIFKTNFLTTDSTGLAVSCEEHNANGNTVRYFTYTYNSKNEKTNTIEYNATYIQNGKTDWEWSGGNMWHYAVYDSALAYKTYDAYIWFYDPDETSFGNRNTGQKFRGADSKYLVRKQYINSYLGGSVVNSFEYSFDSQKRITEIRTYSYTGTLKNTDTYTYY